MRLTGGICPSIRPHSAVIQSNDIITVITLVHSHRSELILNNQRIIKLFCCTSLCVFHFSISFDCLQSLYAKWNNPEIPFLFFLRLQRLNVFTPLSSIFYLKWLWLWNILQVSILLSLLCIVMKGASGGHVGGLLFMHPRQIIWKTKIAEQIDHSEVSIHGTGILKLVLICKYWL